MADHRHAHKFDFKSSSLFMRVSLVCASLIVLFFAFWRLDAQPLYEWDESRHGQNALEMMHNGDYINYFYRGVHDTWNAKPPLFIWSVIASYKVFGTNEFALRFPAALAGILTVLATTLLALRFTNYKGALFALAILVSSKGIFGFHTGRTGDMDAYLVALSMCAVLFWQKFLDEKRLVQGCMAGIFWGLAFLSKGVAALALVPGALMLAWLKRGQFNLKLIIFPAIAALILPIGWIIAVKTWGQVSASHLLEGQKGSSLDVMILYDVWERLTGNIEGHGSQRSLGYVFKQWDVYFSPWIYGLYGFAVVTLFRLKEGRSALIKNSSLKAILIWTAGYVLPLALLLTIARSKLPWYIAPTIPFLAILLAYLLCEVAPQKRWKNALLILFLAVAAGRHLKDYIYPRVIPELTTLELMADKIKESSCLKATHSLNQAEILKVSWINPAIRIIEPNDSAACELVLPSS